eukprot:c7575_g1_i2.p1 GENE.c7575_g1_i2~~c7575_g1_i2.p1  ORF type:complete len:430 (+),score=65.57 c7575_g1_i2:107-1396(+)
MSFQTLKAYAANVYPNTIKFDPTLAATQLQQIKQGVPFGVNWKFISLIFYKYLIDGITLQGCVKEGLVSPSTSSGEFHELRKKIAWIVENIAKRQSASQKLPFVCEFVGLTRSQIPMLGIPTDFHSYTWQSSFPDIYHSLMMDVERGDNGPTDERVCRYFWWDIFSQNQHCKGDVAIGFANAIRPCNRLIFNICHPERAIPLGRIWCIYELFTGMQQQKEIRFAWNYQTLRKDQANSTDVFTSVENCAASISSDKTVILGLVRQGPGIQLFNDTISRALHNGFLQAKLWTAVCLNHVAILRDLLAQNRMDPLCARRTDGLTTMHLAAFLGHVDIMQAMYQRINRPWEIIRTLPSTDSLTPAAFAYAAERYSQWCDFKNGGYFRLTTIGDLEELVLMNSMTSLELRQRIASQFDTFYLKGERLLFIHQDY